MRKSGRFLAAALSFALVLATPLSAQATKSGLSDAKSKKTALEAEKKKTEQELKNLEGLKSDTTAYVKKLDSSLESIGNELSKLGDDIDAKEKQIDTTKQELSEAKETEKSQYESMKLRIKYMYEKGDSTYVDLLMESGSLSELLSKAEYITKISSYDRQKLDEYAATKEKIAEKEKSLESEHAELLMLQDETEAKQASVEKLLAAKQTHDPIFHRQFFPTAVADHTIQPTIFSVFSHRFFSSAFFIPGSSGVPYSIAEKIMILSGNRWPRPSPHDERVLHRIMIIILPNSLRLKTIEFIKVYRRRVPGTHLQSQIRCLLLP